MFVEGQMHLLCLAQVIGTISGDGKIILKDPQASPDEPTPVDLHLDAVLGDMPPKTFTFNRQQPILEPLRIPDGTQIMDALHHVLRLPAVGSKRFLTTKADRCVTGEGCYGLGSQLLQKT